MYKNDSKGNLIGKMNYTNDEENDGKCGESEEILRVEDFESVNRGDWVIVTYDSKLYPGKVSNKDVNGMTCDEAMFSF